MNDRVAINIPDSSSALKKLLAFRIENPSPNTIRTSLLIETDSPSASVGPLVSTSGTVSHAANA
jgi:hypothetical protein